jgi:hypothetical protein
VLGYAPMGGTFFVLSSIAFNTVPDDGSLFGYVGM